MKFTPEMDGKMAPCETTVEWIPFCNRSSDIDLILFWYYSIALLATLLHPKNSSWMVETCPTGWQAWFSTVHGLENHGKSMGNLWVSHEETLVFAMESRGFQMFPWSNPLKKDMTFTWLDSVTIWLHPIQYLYDPICAKNLFFCVCSFLLDVDITKKNSDLVQLE